MAEKLGGFLISVGADLGKFESDLGKANQMVGDVAGKMAKAFVGISAVVGTALGAHAFVELIEGALHAQDALSKMSQRVGISTETLSGMTLAAKQAGVENETLQKGLIKLAQSSAAAANGGKEQAAAYAAIGISVKDASGNLKPMDKLLGEVSDKFKSYKDSAEKTVLATTLFGKAGAELIPLLNAGSEGLAEYTKLAEDFGLVVGSKAAKDAERFNDTLEQLSFVSGGVANQIATVLSPALAEFAEKAVAFFRSDTWKTWLNNIAGAFKLVVENLDKIGKALIVVGEIAVAYIGSKLVNALALASVEMVALTVKTLAASSAAAEMGLSYSILGKGIIASTAESVKSIGALPLALGVVTAAFAGWQIGTYLSDNFLEAKLAGIAFVDGMLVAWEKIKQGGQLAWESVKAVFQGTLNFMREGLAGFFGDLAAKADSIPDFLGGAKAVEGLTALAAAIKPAKSAAAEFAETAVKINAEAAANIKAIHGITGEMTDDAIAADNAAQASAKAAAGVKGLGDSAGTTAPNVIGLAGATDAAAKALDDFNKAGDAAEKFLLSLSDNPLQHAFDDLSKGELDAKERMQDLIKTGHSAAEANDFLAKATQGLTDKFSDATEAIERQADVLGRYTDDLANDRALLNLTEREKAITQAVQAATKSWEENKRAGIDNKNSLAEVVAGVRSAEGAYYDQSKAIGAAREQTEQYQSIAVKALTSVGDAIAQLAVSGFKSFKDFGASLLNIAKQAVAEIIATFLKLQVINPILASLFGGTGTSIGSGLVSSVAGMAINSGASSVFGGGGGTSGGGIMANIGTAYTAWKNGGSFFGTLFGGGSVNGAPAFAGSHAAAVTTPGTFATYAPWAGAVLGAAYGWQQGGDTKGKIAGAAAYGTAAYVGTGLATGSIAGLTAIPVVGWIALAAIIVDKISGGKLFGTKFQTKTTTQAIDVNNTGAQANFSAYQTGQKSFFGGIKEKNIKLDVPQDVKDALAAYFDALKKTTTEEAKEFEVAAPDLIAGNFVAVYDKKGKLISQTGTILGKKFEESFEDFQKRLMAVNIINVAALADGAAKTITDKFANANADTFLAIATAVADIETGIKAGFKTLDGKDTLQGVYDFITAVQQAGESLDDAYHRVAAATAAYYQQVANLDAQIDSFLPQGTDFEQALGGIEANMKAFKDSLNAAAIAAGAAGARTEDLAKADKLLAMQAKQLADALTMRIGQEVADLFGDRTQQKVDAKNAEADALQKRIDTLTAQGGFQAAAQLTKQQQKLRDEAQAIADKKKADDEKLQKTIQAQALVKDLADLSIFGGKTLKELETQFGFTGEELAAALGIDPSKLDSYFSDSIDAAKAFIDMPALQKITNDILNAILVSVGGTALGTQTSSGTVSYTPTSGGKGAPTTIGGAQANTKYNTPDVGTGRGRQDPMDRVGDGLDFIAELLQRGDSNEDGRSRNLIDSLRATITRDPQPKPRVLQDRFVRSNG